MIPVTKNNLKKLPNYNDHDKVKVIKDHTCTVSTNHTIGTSTVP